MSRVFDIIVSFLALVFVLPLFVAVPILIILDSRGPVFFRQERVGFGRNPFKVLKFRSMVHFQPGDSAPITVGRDPRITRIGKLIRACKIDELPQFLNVLAGQMSVVGPRPEVPRYVALYPEPTAKIIFSVRPGITDPASVQFRNESDLLKHQQDPEAFYCSVLLPRKLKISCDYIMRRTILTDLGIILKTFLLCFRR